MMPGVWAGVVTTRAHVQTVITEFGVAQLHGRTIPERARALIAIAHPAFRDELQRKVRETFPNVKSTTNAYGLTESSSVATARSRLACQTAGSSGRRAWHLRSHDSASSNRPHSIA